MQCPRCHRYLPADHHFCPYDGAETVDRVDSRHIASEPTKLANKLLKGRYRIRGFVGMGSMARVYLAQDQQSGYPVAIKVLEDPYREDPGVRERFQREARMASMIGHPSIVQIFDEGEREEDGAPFLAMEFLAGETVASFLERQGKMPIEMAIPALQQAASALGAAHRIGIIHRDVKAENLFLIGEPGSPYELKVVDFGLSKLPSSNLTAAGVVMGTPSTMAPEQVLSEPIDGRADIYALGTVAYRMLTGRQPFQDADDEIATLAHHVWTEPESPRKHAPELDPRVEQVIMTCLRKNPADRYASMEELAETLERVREAGPTMADPLPPDVPYKTQSLVGQLVKASLGRAIDREEESE